MVCQSSRQSQKKSAWPRFWKELYLPTHQQCRKDLQLPVQDFRRIILLYKVSRLLQVIPVMFILTLPGEKRNNTPYWKVGLCDQTNHSKCHKIYPYAVSLSSQGLLLCRKSCVIKQYFLGQWIDPSQEEKTILKTFLHLLYKDNAT